MGQSDRNKALVKTIFWLLASGAIISYMVYAYTSGQMIRWYYYTASVDGYAIDADTFARATHDNPAQLKIGTADAIEGLQAVPIRVGDRLPEHANGVISEAELKESKRVTLDAAANTIRVMTPSLIKEQKGFKYKDTFKHKGVRTNPWSGAWNVAVILLLGLSLGLLAEGITDFMGLKIEKIDHAIGH
jgi:hypothetical protein